METKENARMRVADYEKNLAATKKRFATMQPHLDAGEIDCLEDLLGEGEWGFANDLMDKYEKRHHLSRRR